MPMCFLMGKGKYPFVYWAELAPLQEKELQCSCSPDLKQEAWIVLLIFVISCISRGSTHSPRKNINPGWEH